MGILNRQGRCNIEFRVEVVWPLFGKVHRPFIFDDPLETITPCGPSFSQAYISYYLGDVDVIEKTCGLDPDKVASQTGFQHDSRSTAPTHT